MAKGWVTMEGALVVKCLVCDGIIEIRQAEVGKQVDCPDCEELFEVTSLDPLELGYALDREEEGWLAEDERGQR